MYAKTTNYYTYRKGDIDYCINLEDGELFFNQYYHDGEPFYQNLERSNKYEFEQAFNLFVQKMSKLVNSELPKSNLEIFIKSNQNNISVRLYNTLNYAVRNGFKEVCQLTKESMQKIPYCGKKTINEFLLLVKDIDKSELH